MMKKFDPPTKYVYEVGKVFGVLEIVDIVGDNLLGTKCITCGTRYVYSKRELCNKVKNKSCRVCRQFRRPDKYKPVDNTVYPELKGYEIGMNWIRGQS